MLKVLTKTKLNSFLISKRLNFEFDIICLTEILQTNMGLIELIFPNYYIFLDNPNTAKGGVAILLKKDKFSNITELSPDYSFELKKTSVTVCIVRLKTSG